MLPFPFHLKKLFLIMGGGQAHMHAGVRGLEPGLELEAAVSSLDWVMRTDLDPPQEQCGLLTGELPLLHVCISCYFS